MLKEKAVEDGLELYSSVTVAAVHGPYIEISVFPNDVTGQRIDEVWYVEDNRAIRKREESGDGVLA